MAMLVIGESTRKFDVRIVPSLTLQLNKLSVNEMVKNEEEQFHFPIRARFVHDQKM